jgi:hypothetical protein
MAWTAYLFQYLTGGIVFALGLFAIVKSGSCRLRVREERKWFLFLIIGYVWMALLHLLWTLAALYL